MPVALRAAMPKVLLYVRNSVAPATAQPPTRLFVSDGALVNFKRAALPI